MSEKRVSRREFLKIAGVGLAATAFTCSSLGYAATRQPQVDLPEMNLEKENAMKKILVTYSTRAGSTAEIAATIGQTLSQRGYSVDVLPVKKQPNPSDYDAVILGSPIRMGSWLPEVIDFIKENRTLLEPMPVAVFTVHMLNSGNDEESRTNRQAYLNAVREWISPAEEVFFLGKMELAKLSFLDRFISNVMKAKDEDLRDWNTINAFAESVFA
ncbi:flavodoxin domain-containing protein [Bellilinea sp.]|uniref:Flavodoxin n=1 Tax=Bellilinea caldifistulae TaxID=360411 RepID=A0A7C4PZR7_9CHLR|nr:flavodoxin domain-containing protein [Bellilinea sp.]